MKDTNLHGHVEFKEPPAKLVADMPGDEEMRQNLDEMQANDAYPGGSCAVINEREKE